MKVISPSPSTASCRRLSLHLLLCMYLVAVAPTRTASYRSPSLYADSYVHRRGQNQPAVVRYSDPGNTIESPDRRSNRPGSASIYGRLAEEQQRSTRTQPGAEDVVNGAVDSGPRMVGEWASRNSVRKTDGQAHLAFDYGSTLRNDGNRVAESADLSPEGYARGRPGTGHGGKRLEPMPPFQPPPSSSVLPDLFSPLALNGSSSTVGQSPTWPPAANHNDRGRHYGTQQAPASEYPEKPSTQRGHFNQASRNSVSKTDAHVYSSSAYGASLQNNRKRAVEMADLSLMGYDRLRPRTGNGKRHRSGGRRQVFEPMPPFQPPPSSSILPDLFSPHSFNGSSSIIGQRPTWPSAIGFNPDGTPGGGRGHPPGDHGFHSANREPQLSSQGPQHRPDDQGLPFHGQEPYGPETEQTDEITEDTSLPETDGIWEPFSRPVPPVPSTAYQELPAPGSSEYTDMPDVQHGYFSPRDVLVKIETRRLQLTYSVNAPPYFTFESLLTQLATYLMPGFCVDLAVTRRDERCEIISHLAALKTDRLQDWLIEISDNGGKIIWMNQCIPDTRLFIVPGFRVSFKYGSRVLTPASAPDSTPEAAPVATGPARQETAQPEEGVPVPYASDDGWQHVGSPLVPQRQASENS